MPTQVLPIPDLLTERDTGAGDAAPWDVTLHNDAHHTVKEVVLQVQKATGVSLERAFEITMTVHTEGQAVCFTCSLPKCEPVAAVLREIDLTVTLNPSVS